MRLAPFGGIDVSVGIQIQQAATGVVFGVSESTRPLLAELPVTVNLVVTEVAVLDLSWAVRSGVDPSTCEALGLSTVIIGVPSGTLYVDCVAYGARLGAASGPANLYIEAGGKMFPVNVTMPRGGQVLSFGPVDLAF